MLLYHVTDVNNLYSIAKDGLVPQIGLRAQKINEQKEAIYFFVDKNECINAIMNWLGEEFDEEDAESGIKHYHVVLECDVDNVDDIRFYEIMYYNTVPPENIRICSDISVDFDVNTNWIVNNFPELADFC